jgi:hypothetical protein
LPVSAFNSILTDGAIAPEFVQQSAGDAAKHFSDSERSFFFSDLYCRKIVLSFCLTKLSDRSPKCFLKLFIFLGETVCR